MAKYRIHSAACHFSFFYFDEIELAGTGIININQVSFFNKL